MRKSIISIVIACLYLTPFQGDCLQISKYSEDFLITGFINAVKFTVTIRIKNMESKKYIKAWEKKDLYGNDFYQLPAKASEISLTDIDSDYAVDKYEKQLSNSYVQDSFYMECFNFLIEETFRIAHLIQSQGKIPKIKLSKFDMLNEGYMAYDIKNYGVPAGTWEAP